MIVRKERLGGFVYQVYGKRNGKKVYVRTYDNRKAALAADEDHRVTTRKIEAGELPPEVDSKRTITQSIETWLDTLKKRGSRSHKTYGNYVRSYVLPHLGPVPVARLTKPQVLGWRDKLIATLAPKTVNTTVVVLSSAFRFFVDECGWAEMNPCHGIKPLEVPEGVYTWIRTAEEMTKLLVECPRGIRNIVAVALGTGMRLDEILHLHWADIDIDRRLITVHRGRQGPAKSGKARWVPILDTLLPLLRELRLKRDGAELVFPSPSSRTSKRDGAGKKKLAPRTKPSVQYPFKQAVARVGLPKQLRFHDLRHTFASHWVLNGGDIFRLSKCLGHSSVVITQKFYAHLAPEAWERDYARISFVVPREDVAHGTTKRQAIVARENAELRAV
jgi:integrase